MTHEQTLATPSQHRSKWLPALSVWQRFVCEWLIIGSLGVAIVSACVYGKIAANIDRLIYDRLLTLHTQPLARDIAIVSIDDESVSQQGRWPWPRDLQARLIDAVARAGAAAIVYDVLLTEPAPGDDELARALHAAPTYLPLFVDPRGGTAVVRPLPRFATAAAASGHIDVEPDPDGIIRGVSLQESARGASWPYIVVPLFNDIRSGKIKIAGGRSRADRGESMATVVGSSDEVRLDRPRRHRLAARLPDLAQRHGRAVWRREPQLLPELPPRRVPGALLRGVLALRQRPRTRPAPRVEGTAHVAEEHLRPATGAAEEQQARAAPHGAAPGWAASRASTVSASSGRLSSRWRSTRAKRSVTPAG